MDSVKLTTFFFSLFYKDVPTENLSNNTSFVSQGGIFLNTTYGEKDRKVHFISPQTIGSQLLVLMYVKINTS